MAGYAVRLGDSTGTTADLMARVTVFDDGDTPVVLVVLDLLYATQALTRAVREAVAGSTPVMPEHVIVTATHTHNGPADLATTQGSVVRLFVADACARAAERAWSERREARLVTGEIQVRGISAHRRTRVGVPDETLTLVAALDEKTGDPIVSIVNFACHATVHGPEMTSWSPDFPGAVCASLESWAGGTVTFLQGCAGDVNPVVSTRDWADASRIGEIVAAASLQLLRDAQGLLRGLTTESPSLESTFPAQNRSRCRLVAPSCLELASVLVDVDPGPRPTRHTPSVHDDPFTRSRLWIEDLRARDGNLFGSFDAIDRLTVQVVRLGVDLHLVALPGEPMSVAGRLLRGSGPGTVLVAGYADASVGYLPAREDHLVGGYEVGACAYEPGALERLVDAAATTLRELR